MVSAAIYGCQGSVLNAEEHAFFRDADPWGFILFRRNIETADQVIALCAALRESIGRNAPILIDHEGGRVTRLSPELAPPRPPAALLGEIVSRQGLPAAEGAARLFGRLLAHDCRRLGIDVDCVPMVDVRQSGAHDIVGDRAFAEDPIVVAKLGAALAAGLEAGGVLPVVKHIPGHGRAMADSHHELPRVGCAHDILSDVDFVPFKLLNQLPLGMTAHIVYEALDPERPATCSPKVIEESVRGEIGFQGLLMTDDLSMKALSGDYRERAERALAAGCDLILHCNGKMDEMQGVAAGTGPLAPARQALSDEILRGRKAPEMSRIDDLEAEFGDIVSAYGRWDA
ncbi:glycosyl hydrolase, family 3 [Parvularcula bermudensis HTCC2503]|uniref:beta-N-acetylhexosaminidase n=1 Tax=Parvularcula bermudensis (strain ATCC BAA-594 / HTCC2503 / KCTC 12087) TaxID=314260 RepID=E0TEB5_PARBH|nr:beta-N-acetylhexosaminidase [Parvularcula bermudensis]ADM09490.1 glycosyl hydrolase, family 3 [Parvularcula bermudensis HTCC2503]